MVARNDNTCWRGQEREGGIINLDIIERYAWLTYFRFTHEEVLNLVVCLQIPDPVRSDNGIVEDSLTALCMLLAHFAWPNRLSDLHVKFGWKPEMVSRTINTLLSIIHDRWKHLLVFDEQCLTPERLTAYTIAIAGKDAPLESCIGFIDGTKRQVTKPIFGQESIYNGWKKIHCLKYQAIVYPDGIIAHLYGPVEGVKHHIGTYRESIVEAILDMHAYAPDGTPLQIYCYSAYGLNDHLISSYRGVDLTEEEKGFNKAMASVRIVVE